MKMKKAVGLICCVFMICLTVSPCAFADVKIQELSTVFDEFTVGMDLGLFYRVDSNPYFGAKLFPDGDDSTNWGEMYGRIKFTARKDLGWTDLSAQLAPIYLATVGQDVYGVYKDTDTVAIDRAWLKFGRLVGPLDFPVGMQDIDFEKQFLVGTARGQDAALWFPEHSSWPFAVRLDGDFGAFNTTAFWGRTSDYTAGGGGFGPPAKDDIQGAGLNLHYDIAENNYIYGGAVAKIDNSGSSGRVEQNTQAFNLGFDLAFAGLNLEGEGAYQIGDVDLLTGEKLDRKAYGGNLRAKYTFPIQFDPYIKLHYIYLSGDSDPTDGDNEEWDPMFWGFPAWNYQVIGELVGEAQLATPNTNKDDIIVEVGFAPFMPFFVSLSYIKHRLAEEYVSLGEGAAIPVSSKDWADEINLFIDWPIHDNLFIHCGLGYVVPGDAAEEYYGSDDNATFGQLFFNYSF
jgi:hypothetical protein